VDRFQIHFFSSFSLVVLLFFLVDYLRKKPRLAPWLPDDSKEILLLAGMTLFAGSTLREAYDVSIGQPLVKALTDYASWLIGSGCSIWGVYRLLKRGL
jgi:hypothetical protein